jgi:protein-S-isoprenylcysteine O-methyltransferase Ste14
MRTEDGIKLVLFVIVTAWLVYFSRESLRVPRSHGFYRFFAFECILALFLVNVGRWLHDPFSPAQWISWILLVISGFLVLHGVLLLRRLGRPDRARQDIPLLDFEKTTTLVTEGAYRYIRHPLYSSLLLLAWGIFFKDPTLLAGVLALGASGFLWATAKADEAECVRFFGPSYQEYMQRTKRFIPFLF